jgi:dihydroorotase
MTTLSLRRPDDWHVHLRDGALLKTVLPYTANVFARAIVMPNLKPPVVTAKDAGAYRERIRAALSPEVRFEPLMTVYLTDLTDPQDLVAGAQDGVITAAKLYPAGATTNSEFGVTRIDAIEKVLVAMEKAGVPLLVHGEATDKDVDVFDREAAFIERALAPLVNRHPALKVVLEHVTTKEGVAFVESAGPNVGATVTAHHLTINRNAMFEGGIRPHMYCLPVAKREVHRLALVRAATSGNPKFFLGTDSAPHPKHLKEAGCGCAGLFTAPVALSCYADVFEREGKLDTLEAFASLHGPRFYGLEPNADRITLAREQQSTLGEIRVEGSGDTIVPFRAGERVAWSVREGSA